MGAGLFSQITTDRRGNAFKLYQGRSRLEKILSKLCSHALEQAAWGGHHPWRYLKDKWMWQLGTWFSGDLGSAELVLGPRDLKVFSNLNDSMILCSCAAPSPLNEYCC